MDRTEFEELALAEMPAVYRFAGFLTRNPTEAADLAQEVYARAFRPQTVESFEFTGGGMRPWLFRIARTTYLMRLERVAVERKAMPRVGRPESQNDAEAPAADSAAGFDWERVDGRLKSAMDELEPQHREILMLWGIEGLKYREIAEVLEIPTGTVMSRLHRARGQVAKRLLADEQTVVELGLRPMIERERPARGRRRSEA